MSLQVPLHNLRPVLQMHELLLQKLSGGHVLPHWPQFWVLEERSVQRLSHTTWPAGQVVVHTPFLHCCPILQELLQLPQLLLSLLRSAHIDKPLIVQSCCPVGQPHFCELQDWLKGQIFPHLPQLFLSLLRSTHLPLQLTSPLLQQRPLEQICPVEQALPHAPQLVLVSTSVHVPLQQACLSEQAAPHLPQLSLLEDSLTQVFLQQLSPALQAFPQAPQCLLSLSVTHAPEQLVWPEEQLV